VAERHVVRLSKLAVPSAFSRADLEFYRIDHFRPSYVAQVFLNDPQVDEDNASDERESYAGSFAIFGHGQCFGDKDHCKVHTHLRRFDDRPSHPLTRAFKRILVTDALRRAADAGELTVTVIATVSPEDEGKYEEPLLGFEGLQLTTFI
jgi:hypothetical protein